ncbi:J domain-containing protein [Marinoscillum furvescens]|uniref:DnaJ-like protein n=1 Tax=Marinoscillum furvescens DSM 4134 TaxID=1122208 RepID=A0A3D9LJ22_MARFU|nr:J domain-containing protein [Marinoscillum furvescens]REE05656.1 DnaJ-like protein [Marinoscillum furvescens DSM 4134]
MQNHYLNLLELEPGATKQDVKAAYRRLSKKYHPDLNKHPEAREQFIAITEAYNFLMKVGPTPHQEQVNYDYNPAQDEYERWRQDARERARRKAHEIQKMRMETIRKTFYVMDIILLGAMVFNLLLALDYSLPYREHEQEVVGVSRVYEKSKGRAIYRYDDVQFTDFRMRFDQGEVVLKELGKQATVRASAIFRQPISATLMLDGEPRVVAQIYSVYATFSFLIPFQFLVLGLYRYVTKRLDPKIGVGLLAIFTAIIQLYLFYGL